MKSYLVALVGLVMFLSACSGGLKQGPAELEAQRVDSCSYQGAAFQSGNDVAADASANCTVVKNGYDYVSAVTSLERRPVGSTGAWYTVATGNRVTYNPQSATTYNLYFEHLKASKTCLDGYNDFRAKMTVRWENSAGSIGGSTFYTSPSKRLGCY